MCKEETQQEATPCQNCGLLFVQKGARGKLAQFCGEACNKAWQRRKVRVKCPCCKKAFELLLPRLRKAS